MYMYNILAITNRNICKGDFLKHIENICTLNKVYGKFKIVLREKDLSEEEYEKLSKDVLNICRKYNVGCMLHTYYNVAKELGCDKIHLPLNILRENPELRDEFKVIGASIHSKEDAIEAEKLGASYITAGHIFNTDCKKGIPGRGIEFLKDVVQNVNIPVYAIGGISSSNMDEVIKAGAYGVCIMSGLMKYDEPKIFFDK